MFMGTYNNSIDAKNRMIVPSKHRVQLGESCVLTIGMEKCLNIYSMEAWDAVQQKLSEIPESDLEARKFVRAVYSNAAPCDFDKQGRIIIPDNLKEYADIKKDLVTMGVMNKIEVWAKEVWTAPGNTDKMDQEAWAKALLQYGF